MVALTVRDQREARSSWARYHAARHGAASPGTPLACARCGRETVARYWLGGGAGGGGGGGGDCRLRWEGRRRLVEVPRWQLRCGVCGRRCRGGGLGRKKACGGGGVRLLPRKMKALAPFLYCTRLSGGKGLGAATPSLRLQKRTVVKSLQPEVAHGDLLLLRLRQAKENPKAAAAAAPASPSEDAASRQAKEATPSTKPTTGGNGGCGSGAAADLHSPCLFFTPRRAPAAPPTTDAPRGGTARRRFLGRYAGKVRRAQLRARRTGADGGSGGVRLFGARVVDGETGAAYYPAAAAAPAPADPEWEGELVADFEDWDARVLRRVVRDGTAAGAAGRVCCAVAAAPPRTARTRLVLRGPACNLEAARRGVEERLRACEGEVFRGLQLVQELLAGGGGGGGEGGEAAAVEQREGGRRSLPPEAVEEERAALAQKMAAAAAGEDYEAAAFFRDALMRLR